MVPKETSDIPEINPRVLSYYDVLKRVKTYLDNNYHESITLETIAKVAGMEKKYLSAFFRKKTGVTIFQWLRKIRIFKAKVLLETHDFSITEVAGMVGYADLSAFERTFKKFAGVPPAEYKKSVRPA